VKLTDRDHCRLSGKNGTRFDSKVYYATPPANILPSDYARAGEGRHAGVGDDMARAAEGTICMFTHVMVGVADFGQSKTFYDAIMGALGIGPAMGDGETRAFYVTPGGGFGITKPIDGEAPTHANGGTIGFAATSTEQVDAWHAAGIAAGGTACEDPPGVRDLGPAGKLYAAYLRDPVGNKLVASFRLG